MGKRGSWGGRSAVKSGAPLTRSGLHVAAGRFQDRELVPPENCGEGALDNRLCREIRTGTQYCLAISVNRGETTVLISAPTSIQNLLQRVGQCIAQKFSLRKFSLNDSSTESNARKFKGHLRWKLRSLTRFHPIISSIRALFELVATPGNWN